AVWGNTDGWELRDVASARVEVELDGMRFGVAHGHRVATFERLVDEFPGVDAIVHGHSHVPRRDLVDGVWFLNPGSAGPGGEGWPPSVAVAEVRAGELSVAHLELATGRELSL
ncbi:MAG: metallophosphoesterase family protein, partial [Gemmatimonadota bacterium]